MRHSTPRANFEYAGGSSLRLNLGSAGILARYPAQIENSEGVITIRHQCSSRFSLAVISQDDETDDIEVDWGDGTVTQETPYQGVHFPQYAAAEATAWHHTYADATPRTITITPVSNTQIKSLGILPMMFSYTGGVGEEFYEVLSIDLSDAPALRHFSVDRQPDMTEINMVNSINVRAYHVTNCENLQTITFASGYLGSTYEVYLTNTGITSVNLPSVSKASGIRLESSDNLTALDLSAEHNHNLTSIGCWSSPNLSSLVLGEITVLNTVNVTNCNLSVSNIDTLLAAVVFQCQNPQPNPEDVASYEQQIVAKEAEIAMIEDNITAEEANLVILENELAALEAELEGLTPGTPEYDAKQDEINDKYQEINDKQGEIDYLNENLGAAEEELEELETNLQQLYDDVEPITNGSFGFGGNPGAVGYNTADADTLRNDFSWDVDDGFGSGEE